MNTENRYAFPEATDPPSPVTEPSSSLLPAIAAGLVAAIVGGIVWGLIVKVSDYEVGFVAWGIGFIAGTAVVLATRGAKGPRLQVIAVVSALLGILLGKYLSYAFVVQEEAESFGASIGLVSGDMFRFFREDLDVVFSLFDLLWVGLAVFTAWRIPQVDEPEPATEELAELDPAGRAAVLDQVLLVVLLGGPEHRRRDDLRGDRLREPRLRPRLRLRSGLRLLRRVREDRGPILRADVPALPVHLGRIVKAPERVHELAVGDLARVERHLDPLRVPRAAAADVLVGRILGLAADVADLDVGDARRVPELDLDAPEAAGREGRGLRRALMCAPARARTS